MNDEERGKRRGRERVFLLMKTEHKKKKKKKKKKKNTVGKVTGKG